MALSGLLLVMLPSRLDALSRRWMESRALGIALLVARSTEPALDFDDGAAAANALAPLGDGALYAVLSGQGERPLAVHGRPPPRLLPPAGGPRTAYEPDLLRVQVPVLTRAGMRGTLEVGFGLEELEARHREARTLVAGLSAVLLVAGLALAWAMGTVLVRPVRRITEVATRIAAGDEGAAGSLPLERTDEAGAMAAALRRMLERVWEQAARIREMNRDLALRVEERTAELARTSEALAELRRTQQQLVVADRRVSIGRLAAGVGHEINNPLSYVSGNLDWLRTELGRLQRALSSGDPSARAGALQLIGEMAAAVMEAKEGTDRVRRIVRQLKVFSHGGDDEGRERASVAEAIGVALDMSAHEIRHRAQAVKSFREAPPVLASPVQLAQVFVNLLVNAAQAIPVGAADRNEIRVSLGTDESGWAVASVRDTGSGIPEDVRSRLFDPFFTTKPVGEGSGLGLAVSQGIVRSLGGEITVESEVGAGSTFTVRLPPCPPDVEASPVRQEPASTPPPRRLRLLLVDDEPLVTSSLVRSLGSEHWLTVSGSGREALARIEAGERFDVILCDLMMPEMTGMELHAELARLLPDQAARVVLMTGGGFSEGARAFLASWSGPCLEKPVDLDKLRRLFHERCA
ncbi:MAG TPA: ATP-binding protein [Anaeromyxobacteraceae bacterium]|nr:ATP-binding protein [Anaeromyxobacteraceae bacterium]